jgi:hypothetical protein
MFILQLNASTLSNLQTLANYIEQSDYNNALALHRQMVNGWDFAEISAFMPALKTMVQTALQSSIAFQ